MSRAAIGHSPVRSTRKRGAESLQEASAAPESDAACPEPTSEVKCMRTLQA